MRLIFLLLIVMKSFGLFAQNSNDLSKTINYLNQKQGFISERNADLLNQSNISQFKVPVERNNFVIYDANSEDKGYKKNKKAVQKILFLSKYACELDANFIEKENDKFIMLDNLLLLNTLYFESILKRNNCFQINSTQKDKILSQLYAQLQGEPNYSIRTLEAIYILLNENYQSQEIKSIFIKEFSPHRLQNGGWTVNEYSKEGNIDASVMAFLILNKLEK